MINKELKNIIDFLLLNNKNISIIDSCTNGYILNKFNCLNNSNKVINCSLTLEDYNRILDIVNKENDESDDKLAKKLYSYTKSNINIIIKGNLGNKKLFSISNDDLIDISIYYKDKNKYTRLIIKAKYITLNRNKKYILDTVIKHISKNIK